MKISTPTIRIPSFTFRLDVLIGVLVLYLLIVCLLFGSCLKISFTEGMDDDENINYDPTLLGKYGLDKDQEDLGSIL